jgi:hypothetical protein
MAFASACLQQYLTDMNVPQPARDAINMRDTRASADGQVPTVHTIGSFSVHNLHASFKAAFKGPAAREAAQAAAAQRAAAAAAATAAKAGAAAGAQPQAAMLALHQQLAAYLKQRQPPDGGGDGIQVMARPPVERMGFAILGLGGAGKGPPHGWAGIADQQHAGRRFAVWQRGDGVGVIWLKAAAQRQAH